MAMDFSPFNLCEPGTRPPKPRRLVSPEGLADRLRKAQDTQMLVGDFNLTPFSLKLNSLAFKANLRRHATLGASWPAGRFMPVVLLDNLLANPEVKAVNVRYGAASYGSDHYPLTFDIALD